VPASCGTLFDEASGGPGNPDIAHGLVLVAGQDRRNRMKGIVLAHVAKARRLLVEALSSSIFLFVHDLFGKPISAFPDHVLAHCTIEFSSFAR
jgi:hypothetical protein